MAYSIVSSSMLEKIENTALITIKPLSKKRIDDDNSSQT